jgi:hypothetical protein
MPATGANWYTVNPQPALYAIWLLIFGIAGSSPAISQWASWDQTVHIQGVSRELAGRVRQKGADQALAEIQQCYRDSASANVLTKPLEKCLIQDAVHSWVTASVYGKASKETLEKMNLPTPEVVLQSMSRRVTAVFRKYKIPEDKAREFMQAVRQHGLAAYADVLRTR